MIDLAKAFYAAVGEVRDGGLGEIEVVECVERDDGSTYSLSITVRRTTSSEAYVDGWGDGPAT